MFIANDSNYTFGQFLAVENGDDIKAPVYSKCFTETEALKGYRFIHDPEETDPEKCVCFSIYDDVSSEATSTAFGKDAVVSDLTSVMFRLDTKILDSGKVRDEPYYHVIVPVVNIADDTVKYLVIKMTKEVELFPENYPYYELVDTFADAKPTSAEAPGGVTPTGTIQITENDTYDVTNYASAEVNVSGGSSGTELLFTYNATLGDYQSVKSFNEIISDASTAKYYIVFNTTKFPEYAGVIGTDLPNNSKYELVSFIKSDDPQFLRYKCIFSCVTYAGEMTENTSFVFSFDATAYGNNQDSDPTKGVVLGLAK